MSVPSAATSLELAFKSLLDASSLTAGVTVYVGADDVEQVVPCVICEAVGGDEIPLGTGNYMIRMQIIGRGFADQQTTEDPSAVELANFAKVLTALKWDNLGAQLTARGITSLYVFDPVLDRGLAADKEGRAFKDSIAFDVYCCPSVIS